MNPAAKFKHLGPPLPAYGVYTAFFRNPGTASCSAR